MIEIETKFKGTLKDCPLCRFGKKCSLPGNEINKAEEKKGRCVYFIGLMYKKEFING